MAKAGAALTMGDLKSYVGNGPERQVLQGTILLDLTHNYLKNRYAEIAFDLHWTIERVKRKLYTTFGTSPEMMDIFLEGVPMSDNERTLASYNPKPRDTIHCVDNDPYSNAKGGGLEDVSLVEKYVMSDEDYDKREGTLRAYKKKMLEQDPNWVPPHVLEARENARIKAAEARAAAGLPPAELEEVEELEAVLARMKVGDRCEVIGGRRGEIMYVGPVPQIKTDKPHTFVGVKYDEADGKHDGAIQGKRYFECLPSHGAFVKSFLVKAGDYPEKDPFASDDEDEDLLEEL
jgi:tubulin-folding cofactor B